MLILVGTTLTIALKGDLFNLAKKTSVETRASMVEEKVAEWKANKKIDEYLEENSNTQILEELLNDLEEQQLITNEERKEIEDNMEVIIGDKEILFYELPDGYTRCEYLESTGTQYIDTGIKPERISRIETDCCIYSHDTSIYGAYNSTSNRVQAFRGNIAADDESFLEYRVFGTNQYYNKQKTCASTTRIKSVLDIKNLKGIFNDDVFDLIDGGGKNINYPIWLFCANNAGTIATISRSRIYSYKHYKNDVLVQNLIPCQDNNNRPCMYDVVSKKAFYNQGEGEFNVGYKN